MEKLIYHGSGTQDLKELKPQIPRDEINKDEPCAIYAIAHRGMATILGFDATELLKTFMCVNNTPDGPVINYFADMSEKEFWKHDHAGSVYAFYEKDFVYHDNPSIAEYISEQPQKPVEEYQFESLITEAIGQGVNIYCVSHSLYKEIYNDMSQNDIVVEREKLKPLSKYRFVDFIPDYKEEVVSIFQKYWNDEFGKHLENKLDLYSKGNQKLSDENFEFLTALQGNEIIGVSAMRDAPEHMSKYARTENPVEFYVLAVKEQGKGIGSIMRDERIKRAKARGYTEILLFSGEMHQDSWVFHDKYAERLSEMKAPNGEKGFIWSKLL